jgi:hypothetical protein
MALKQRGGEGTAKVGECRQCRSFCDKLVDPRGCVALDCAFLYSYIDELSGRRFMGCMNKVFKGEIDIEALVPGPGGIGGLKMTGDPLPQCQFSVERAYEGSGSEYGCVNPRFFDAPDEVHVFDLRNALT